MAFLLRDNKAITAYRYYASQLEQLYSNAEAKAIVKVLMEDLLGISGAELFSSASLLLSESEILTLNFAVKDMLQGKPLHYVTGKAFFRDMTLAVTPDVLIPRPETEQLVEHILIQHRGERGLRIVDIGTGSGCIALSLARELDKAEIYAVDISEKALKVAEKNSRRYNLEVHFIHANILNPHDHERLPHGLDIVVSNPPYVTEKEKADMHINVLHYEPALALFVPDDDPLLFDRVIGQFAYNRLKPGGKLYFEINENHGGVTADMISGMGYQGVSIIQDLRGKDRILEAMR